MLLPASLLVLLGERGAAPQVESEKSVEAIAQPSDLERVVAARVDDDRARDSVRALVALGPRMGGTPSGLKSVELLEEAFGALELDVQRHLAPERWVHSESGWTLVATPDGGEPIDLTRAWPRGYSPASEGSANLSLEASPENALLAQRWRPRRKGVRPSVVLDYGSVTHDGAYPVCAPHPRGRRAETTMFGISRPEGERLAALLADGIDVEVAWSLDAKTFEAQPITVVASLAPREGARPGHVVVCAHGDSDSGGPGANDNASGVAIVLEIARAWCAAIEEGELERPPIEIRFVVWGSEIHSTRAYMESELGADAVLVLNYDQAGYGTTGQRLHVEPDDLPANEAFVRTAVGVLEDHGGADGFPERWATNKSLGGTDSYVFSGAKRFRAEKLPSVTMFTSAWGSPDEQPRTPGMPGESWSDRDRVAMDYDVHYHSSGDVPENTTDREPENMGWCARVGLLALLRAIEAD